MLEGLKWYHFLIGVALLALASFFAALPRMEFAESLNPSTGEIGVVPVSGPISYGSDFQDSGVSPRTVSRLTEKAVEGGADAILYEINSGGGAVVASRRTEKVIEDVEVPTVCRLKETAASGAYWTASACDRIVSDPLTLTGSIGVKASYLEFSDLLNRYGVDYVNLTSARFKDMGSQFQDLTREERQRFMDVLNTTHGVMVRDIAENRNMSVSRVRELANGEILLGREAENLGLVDVLGGRETAVNLAENMTGTQLRTKTYSPPKRFDILSLLFSSVGKGIAQGMKSMEKSTLRAS